MSEIPTIVFMGCGNMGAAVIEGAIQAYPAARIVGVAPHIDTARERLVEPNRVEFCANLDDAPTQTADLLVLGIKPQTYRQLDAATLSHFGHAPVVSLMAGISLAELRETTGNPCAIRVMPNLAIRVNAGMTLGCMQGSEVATDTRDRVTAIFNAVGEFLWMDAEDDFERCNPLFGCAPGFMFSIAEQFVQAGVAQGLPEALVDRLVRRGMLGAATLLARDERAPEALKNAVASPHGTTRAGLDVLESPEALPALIPATVKAAHDRACELARDK